VNHDGLLGMAILGEGDCLGASACVGVYRGPVGSEVEEAVVLDWRRSCIFSGVSLGDALCVQDVAQPDVGCQ
jgi:hypothetical protein